MKVEVQEIHDEIRILKTRLGTPVSEETRRLIELCIAELRSEAGLVVDADYSTTEAEVINDTASWKRGHVHEPPSEWHELGGGRLPDADEGPGEEDGPWAEGWAERSGAAHLELRTKVAELAGFTDIRDERWENVDLEARSIYSGLAVMGTRNGCRVPVPDYPRDLNAIREVTMSLSKEKRDDFVSALMMLTKTDGVQMLLTDYDEAVESPSTSLYSLVDACPLTRCQALVYMHERDKHKAQV